MTAMDRIPQFDKILERALQERYSDGSIKILEIRANSGTSKGVNFLSDFFKITLRYQKSGKSGDSTEGNVNVVVKSEPVNDQATLEIFRQQDLFGTEWKMYRDVLPKIEMLTSHKIGPRILYGFKDFNTLVMEDLASKGFEMMENKRMPLKHCLLTLTKMATLHGGSVALHEKNPELVESLTGGIISSKCSESFFRLIEVTLLNVSLEIRNWSSYDYIVSAERLKKLAGRIRDELTKVSDYRIGEFCVVNHGDCWVNNVMFKYDERGEPCDALLVDYQMSSYASPAIDLLYFLNICPETSLKCDKDDYFLNVYLTVLTNVMKNAGCVTKPPTIKDLKQAMYKRRAYAVFAGLVLFPRMVANKDDVEKFDEVLGRLKGHTKMNIFKCEEAVLAMRKMIIVMNKRGYFE